MRDLWFQQVGAQKLLIKLPNRPSSLILVIKIGRKKSDLTLLGYFLCGHLKQMAYVKKPYIIPELKMRIT